MAAAKRKTSKARTPRFWLFKSEPEAFSIQDLAAEKNQTTHWDGVRNYQARNMLRDEIQVGDKVFFYHSRDKPMAIVGSMEVVKAGYPDPAAFDPADAHYDPKSNPENPTWFMVDVKLKKAFPKPVTLDELRNESELADMMLLKRGSRLSIQPVSPLEWKVVHRMAGVPVL